MTVKRTTVVENNLPLPATGCVNISMCRVSKDITDGLSTFQTHIGVVSKL